MEACNLGTQRIGILGQYGDKGFSTRGVLQHIWNMVTRQDTCHREMMIDVLLFSLTNQDTHIGFYTLSWSGLLYSNFSHSDDYLHYYH